MKFMSKMVVLYIFKLFIYLIMPHLLKCTKNNLITKNLKFSTNGMQRVATWEHLVQLCQLCVLTIMLYLKKSLKWKCDMPHKYSA